MTLGDFRKITENYSDECSLQIRTENGYGSASSDVVTRVIITTVFLSPVHVLRARHKREY